MVSPTPLEIPAEGKAVVSRDRSARETCNFYVPWQPQAPEFVLSDKFSVENFVPEKYASDYLAHHSSLTVFSYSKKH